MLAKLQSEDRIVRLYDYENDKKREVSSCQSSKFDEIVYFSENSTILPKKC